MQVFLILVLVIAVALVLFAVQNSAIITVSFLSFHLNGSLALVLVVVFILGFLSGIFICVPSLWRKSSALREQKKRATQLEESASMSTVAKRTAQDKADKD